MILNYSRLQVQLMLESDSANSTALLATNGDIIGYSDNGFFVYRVGAPNKFSLKITNGTAFINDKINSICIPDNNDMIPWFENIKTIDISNLDFLYFDSIVPESYVPYLTSLSKTKPYIGMGYNGALRDMTRLFGIFKPGFIVGTGLSRSDFDILSGLSTLGFLSTCLTDSVYTIPLPAMPDLKQLILTDVKEDAISTEDFLINNRQLERLTIMGSGNLNLSLIKPLANLKELIISGYDTIINSDMILDHKQIEVLSVTGKKSDNFKSLKELTHLRWMTFYNEATQDGFNSFIESHPDLEVVEILDNDTIKDLKPLLNLRNLYGLTLTDTVAELDAIKSLKSLKYLSLPYDLLKDSLLKADLQEKLPGTVIVPNQGVCLGSGWLLLIIPLIFIFAIFTRHRSSTVKVIP